MKRDERIPLRRVLKELGISRATFWRARQSNIPGFPEPIIVRRAIFWKRNELERLEEALLRYQGRVKFEGQRKAQKKIDSLKTRARPSKKRKSRSSEPALPQPDLFDVGGQS